jgi:anaerobic glycerol-3-phosphate dehydrogenase
MKIEHNNLIARVASQMNYELALGRLSTNVDPERANQILIRAAQTAAVVSDRIDVLMKHLSDDEIYEVIDAALAYLADTHDQRSIRAIKHQRAQNEMKAQRLAREQRLALEKAKRKEHLRLI